MKNLKKSLSTFLQIIAMSLLLSSCEDVKLDPELSQSEIVEGLKSALKVGTDTSVTTLNAVNGYYGDNLVKILLPEEAAVIVKNIGLIPGGDALLEETIKAINRSAEDAAKEAAPIFVDAITTITIDDGKTILKGADDAATVYLKDKTFISLYNNFQPKINTSLSKELIPGVSAQSSYASLVDKYNAVANKSLGLLKPIIGNSLSEHTTQKGLDGLFLKVALEEGKIRNDISHRVNDILKKVFGN